MSEILRLQRISRVSEPAVVELQGSKSYTNRALVMAALSSRAVTLGNASESDDSKALVEGLEKFGVTFDWSGNQVVVTPPVNGFLPFHGTIDVGPAGTTMRFLTAFFSLVPGCEVNIVGSKRMHERPIAVLVDALRSLGAEIEYIGKDGCPPLRVKGRTVQASEVKLDGSVSSQYFSAILLLAPLFQDGLLIRVTGEQVSRSYIDMTLAAMSEFGVQVGNNRYQSYQIPAHQQYACSLYTVEGDASGASYFWGLAAVSGKQIRVRNISMESQQGDIAFARVMEEMGATVEADTESITVTGPADGKLKACTVDMERMPDVAQTLAVVASFAEGATVMHGLQTLRIKETDRITALQNELGKMGIKTEATEDSLTVYGGTPTETRVKTYDDHRMAMSFAIMAGRVDGIEIEDPNVVTKSFVNFWEDFARVGVQVA